MDNFNPFTPPFMDSPNIPPNGIDMNEAYKDPMLNPILQYEQAFSYYRYLCMQVEYKIKCKEYEKMCSESSSHDPRRRVE